MKEVSSNNFGILIAYLLPGFAALLGLSYFSETVRLWIVSSPGSPATVGGFLYVTLASITGGLTVSTIRWAVVDTIHHRTGIGQPQWTFSRLQENLDAYSRLIEIHYNYYKFYGNMLVSLTIWYLFRRTALGFWSTPIGVVDLGTLLLALLFFAGSRDTLNKYYARVGQLLTTSDAGAGIKAPQCNGGGVTEGEQLSRRCE